MLRSTTTRPPQRTYARRTLPKRPAPRGSSASGSDTETDEPKVGNTAASKGSEASSKVASKTTSKATSRATSKAASKAASRSSSPESAQPDPESEPARLPLRSPSLSPSPSPPPRERSSKRARTETPSAAASPSLSPARDAPAAPPVPNLTPVPITASSSASGSGSLGSRLLAGNGTPTLVDLGSRGSTPLESLGSSGSFGSSGRRPPRRMLSKAQSMALPPRTKGVTPPSTPRKPRASQSMPTPLTPGGLANSPRPASPMAAVAAVAGPASPARATRTYGGKRTFQESADISVDAAPRQSYAELRKRYEVDNDDDEGGRNLLAELQLARAPEPISDMRSKGESKRFTDEIAYLLGGIKDPGLALRRNSSVELLRNMQDGGWVTKLDVHGETEHIFEALVAARGDDEVMDVVVLLFIAILSATSLNTILHADLQTIISVVISNLGKKAGPLDVAYKGKVTRAVISLRDIAVKLGNTSGADDDDDGARQVTTRGVASMILSRICRDSTWLSVEHALINHRVMNDALASLAAEFKPLSGRVALYAKGKDLITPAENIDMAHIQALLEAVSSAVTVSADERERLSTDPANCVKDVLGGMVVMSLLALDDEGSLQTQAGTCTVLALKFITPMAGALGSVHTQPGLRTALTRILVNRDRFAALSTPPSSSESQQQHADAAVTSNDIRDFVLAILGSMLDADAGAAEPIATAAVACGKRSCAVACTCGGERLATTLARMYADAAGSSADAFAAYVAGYLAFLVSRLVELYPSARVLVEPHLPGNGWRAQIEGLLAEVTELLTLRNSAHSKLRAIVEAGEAGEEGEEGERDRVRANTPGAEDNEKLNEAIAFLRGEIEKTQ